MTADQQPTIFFRTNKPYVRWWWFNQPIVENDVESQIRWAAEQGFGGVEIAWVYPLPQSPAGPRWLSKEWTGAVRAATTACSRHRLGCDFTFGSLWPFGDSALTSSDSSQWFSGASPQRIDRHWESRDVPGGPPVLNHLDRQAFSTYAQRTFAAIAPALVGEIGCLFCDSWEVEEDDKLWSRDFGQRFRDRFGYAVEPYMARLDDHPEVRYEYRVLLGEQIIDEFYRPFGQFCRSVSALSRVQCHGAPTDIVAAYSEADIPESEALLFDPAFSRFAASAAAIDGKEIVSCEAFTCIYGWNPWPAPSPHHGEEKIGDLKLLADALAANGVNRYIWHGMPFRAADRDDRFYASVHVGPDGSLAHRLSEFNRYLEDLSAFLREGKPVHRIACLLPLEDVRMSNELPEALRKPSARYWWEFQHPCLPPVLRPWSPLWVSGPFLASAESLAAGAVRFGEATVEALVVDSRYLDASVVEQLARLASHGARIILTRRPQVPGSRERPGYSRSVSTLLHGERTRVAKDLPMALRDIPPLFECQDCPEFFVREQDGDFSAFAAHPFCRTIRYPMTYGASKRAVEETRHVRFWGTHDEEVDVPLYFQPGGSCLFRVGSTGSYGRVPISFTVDTT